MQKILKPLLSLKTKKGYSIFSILVVALFSTWVISDALKTEIVVAADGETQLVKTYHNTVGDVLDELGISIEEHDHLSHSETSQIEDGMEIFFKTANKVVLTIDGIDHIHYTTADTVEQFFEEEDISFSKHDDISHESAQEITEDLNIVVDTAFQVVINDAGKKNKVWITGGTVEQLLEEQKITYGELDIITPSLDKKLSDKNSTIDIINVQLKTENVEEKVAFATEKENDNSLEKGKERTISEGEEGLVEKTYEVTYENGKEAKRELVKEKVKKESKKRVVAVGTKEVQQTVASANSSKSRGSSSPSGGKEFTMQATAYTASCNGCSGYTATGINLNANPNAKVIAVDPSIIPLGSKVWVEGYGTAIAGDTGGSIRGNRIDAHVPNKSAAQQFGRRTVKVKVLD